MQSCGNKKTDSRTVVIELGNHRRETFTIEGRSSAQSRFRSDEDIMKSGSDSGTVSIEIYFHPFWLALGHTSVRIGNSLFEKKYVNGWSHHHDSFDSPRAYLFNNPFFKNQYWKLKNKMSPMSVGISWEIPIEKAKKLRDCLYYWSHSDAIEHSYHLFKRNCTQSILKVLEVCGIKVFKNKWRWKWSSILTFRNFLENHSSKDCKFYLYPIPGTSKDPEFIACQFPKYLTFKHGFFSEAWRLCRTIDKDLIIQLLKKVGFIRKITN